MYIDKSKISAKYCRFTYHQMLPAKYNLHKMWQGTFLPSKNGAATGYATKNDFDNLHKEFFHITDLSKSLLLYLLITSTNLLKASVKKIFTIINQFTSNILKPKITPLIDDNTDGKYETNSLIPKLLMLIPQTKNNPPRFPQIQSHKARSQSQNLLKAP